MDVSLILFIGVVLFFTWRGYKRGLLASLSRVLGLLGGYVAAILYARELSEWLIAHTTLQGLVAFVAASMLLFIGAGIAINVVAAMLAAIVKKLFYSEEKEEQLASFSARAGACTGLLVGVVVGFVLVWVMGVVRPMLDQSQGTVVEVGTAAANPEAFTELTGVELLANRVVGGAVEVAMETATDKPEMAGAAAALMQSPVETAQRLQRLSNSDNVQSLFNDPTNQDVLNSGDPKALAELPAFRQLVDDPDVQALAAMSGISEDNVDQHLAEQVSGLWGRAQEMKNDPRVQEIISDPEFQEQVQSGNSMAMMTNPRLAELAGLLFTSSSTASTVTQSGEASVDEALKVEELKAESVVAMPREEKKLYRWLDENGRVHYTDTPPPKGTSE